MIYALRTTFQKPFRNAYKTQLIAKQRQRRTIFMDISLYYQEKGYGMPFLLLHGNGEDSTYFRHQISYFSNKYRVIAIDTRGHGNSARGTAPFTIEQFADDLNELMTQLQIPQAIILGFSDGANIAMKFVLKYPHKVKALILNGGNLDAKGIKRSVQLPIEIGYHITKLFAAKSQEANRHKELLSLMVDEPMIKCDALHSIQAPTLVIAGTKDMIKQDHTELIAANIPNAKLVIMKGNHFIANKKSHTFNQEIESFLYTIT